MFERRLKILLLFLALPVLVIAWRLVQLQVLNAETYNDVAKDMLYRQPKLFPFLRGQILDRHGVMLAENTGTWNISVHYGVMTDEVGAKKRLLKEWDRSYDDTLADDIETSWQLISELTGVTRDRLQQRVDYIVRKVRLIKKDVADRFDVDDMEVLEEFQYWPVVRDLDRDQQIQARIRLAPYRWVKVVPGQKRGYRGGAPIGPIIGRLGRAPDDLVHDPNAGDSLARYQPGDLMGIRGIEALGETWLRGRRGLEHLDKDGRELSDPVDPENGKDVRLSLDATLQTRVYHLLAAAVQGHPPAPGASAVVIHIPTREVRALVSYPSYDPNIPWEDWLELGEDRKRQPTEFRAIHKPYPPGSVVKPMILAAALADKKLTPETIITCNKVLPDHHPPNKCLFLHYDVDPITAVRKSCNIFFYEVAHRMGVPRLAHWVSQFGLGQRPGTGLPLERAGNVPAKGSRGDARNMAIGQGALEFTPLQAANMVATLASGVYRPVQLWVENPKPRPAVKLPIPDEAWSIVREAMYQVVNEDGGTAYGHHRGTLYDTGDLVMLGKTGSAEPGAIVTEWLFTCEMADGPDQRIAAATERSLRKRDPNIVRVKGRRPYRIWPPKGRDRPTHAWFIGYLTSKERYREPVTTGEMSYAIAVIIEFAGHGGDVAAPIARDIVHELLQSTRQRKVVAADLVAADLRVGRSIPVAADLRVGRLWEVNKGTVHGRPAQGPARPYAAGLTEHETDAPARAGGPP